MAYDLRTQGNNQPGEIFLRRVNTVSICIFTVTVALLGFYELSAKSPALMGRPMPGWYQTQRIERITAWKPATGILPLDKLLHEGEEALRFYGFGSIFPSTKLR